MRVMLIGGGGYIGRPLATMLRERVDTVSVSRRPAPDVDAQADMRDFGEVRRLLDLTRPDVVVVTGYMLDQASNADPRGAVHTNVLGITNVMEAATETGVRRVVLASSGAVHGGRDDQQASPVNESEPCSPTTLYGRMKLFNEWTAQHYNERFDTEIVSFRISGPYGWGRSYERQGGEIPYDTVVAAAGRDRIVLPWGASTRFRFIHVADAAASFLPLILADSLRHRVYNAPGFTVTVGALADVARSVCRLECEFTEPGRPIKFVWWDSTRYEDEFDFRPRPMADWMSDELVAAMAGNRGSQQ